MVGIQIQGLTESPARGNDTQRLENRSLQRPCELGIITSFTVLEPHFRVTCPTGCAYCPLFGSYPRRVYVCRRPRSGCRCTSLPPPQRLPPSPAAAVPRFQFRWLPPPPRRGRSRLPPPPALGNTGCRRRPPLATLVTAPGRRRPQLLPPRPAAPGRRRAWRRPSPPLSAAAALPAYHRRPHCPRPRRRHPGLPPLPQLPPAAAAPV